MNRIHLFVALFVFGFVGLAFASVPQTQDAPADKPAGCHMKDKASCCVKDGDTAKCKMDAKACAMKKNADGSMAKDGCCDPNMECCKDGKCCAAHADHKPAKDASTAAAASCCAEGAACCKPGAACCANHAKDATAAVAANCCAEGAACCTPGAACCAKAA